MTDSLTVAVIGWLVTIIQALLGIVIGWLAYEIRQARKDIANRIHVAECNRRMNEHCADIKELRGLLHDHEQRFHRGNFY